MKLYDIAIRMESEGIAFYQDLAAKATSEGFATIFTMLAKDELKHKAIFEAMRDDLSVSLTDFDLLSEAKEIFASINKDALLAEQDQVALYEEALEIELTSIEFYADQYDELEHEEQKRALEKIIEEERRHYDLLDDIIVMVSRPETWVEHAEFGVRDDY